MLDRSMITLSPISAAEFEDFRHYCLTDEGDDGVIRKGVDKVLTDGAETLNHDLLSIIGDSQSVVGVIWYSVNETNQKAFIFDLVIYPQYQRKGYAKAAMKSLELMLAEQGISKISLSVTLTNQGAISLYEGEGFTAEFVRMSKSIE